MHKYVYNVILQYTRQRKNRLRDRELWEIFILLSGYRKSYGRVAFEQKT